MARTHTYASAVLLATLLSSSLFPSSAAAQTTQTETTIAVSGTVRDVTGGSLAGVVVEARAARRLVSSAVTAEDGRFRLDIPAGVPFELRAHREGFAELTADMSGARRAVTRDLTMQIGGVADRVVVTASRGEQDRGSVTQSVSVVTGADIEALGSASLADAIRYVPGVNVEGSGREGSVLSMFARGGESDYNLVLIDGVRVNTAGGGFDFGRVSLGDVERIEVVRGAQSALWGSDAMGSVVQVITRRGDAGGAPQASASLEGGSFNTWRGDLRVTGGAGRRVDYHLGANHRRTDGAFADLLLDDDAFESSTFDGGVGARLGRGTTLRGSARYSRGVGRSVGPITFGARDTGGSYDTDDLVLHGELSHTVGRRFTGTATANYLRYGSLSEDTFADSYMTYVILTGSPDALFPNGTRLVRVVDEDEFLALSAAGAAPAPGQFLASAFGFDSPFRREQAFDRPALRYQGDFVWAGGRLSGGVEWEHERQLLEDAADYEVDNTAAFVQQQVAFADRLFVTGGLRTDRREGSGTYVSPKLSAGGFAVSPRAGALSSLKLFGNVGRGIKSPTLFERFGDPFSDPSPDLELERARTADLGVEATFASGRVRASATWFDNVYEDQVAWRFGSVGDGIPEYINIDGSQARGWELEAALLRLVAGLSLTGSYTYLDTQVIENLSTSQQFQPGQPLLRRPAHSGTLRGTYTRGRVAVHGDLLVVGNRHDNSFLFLETVPNAAMPIPLFTDITVNPGYAIVGLGADVRLDRQVSAFVRISNVGDKAYDSVLGYPGMPRTVTVGARFRMGR